MAKRAVMYVPTDEVRSQVRTMAGYGLPHVQIATIIGIDKVTMYKHLRAELDAGMAVANLAIGRSLYDQAVGRPAEFQGRKRIREELRPDRSVSIFLGKARLGLKDTQYIALGVEDLDLSRLSDKEAEDLARLVRKANKRAPDAE